MDQFPSSGALSSTPPPPPEVKIRTMRSDLDLLSKSGGGLPQFQKVRVSGLSIERESPSNVARETSKSNILIIILGVAAAIAALIVGWFVYAKFFMNTGSPAAQTIQTQTPAAPLAPPSSAVAIPKPAPPVSPVAAPTSTSVLASTSAQVPAQAAVTAATVPAASTPTTPPAYHSFFKTPADQVLKLTLSSAGAAQTATDLETYNQKLLVLLGGADASAKLIEVDVKAADGHSLDANELFGAQGAQILAPGLVGADFAPFATFFAYRSGNTFWPGYILKPDAGISSASVQAGVRQLESSISISNIFLANAGSPSMGGFTDGTLAATPVRILPFSGGASSADFVYGWTPDGTYLIVSASENGFTAALSRLGE